MILVGQYDSPYVRRVAISLKLAGLQFTRDTRSVFADADEMRRINPLGRIPSLVLDDGEVLIDSGAILDHIDEIIGPDRSLLPARGASRRKALRIVALATGAIDKAGAVAYERMLRPQETIYMPAGSARCIASNSVVPRCTTDATRHYCGCDAWIPRASRGRCFSCGPLSGARNTIGRMPSIAGVRGHGADRR